MFQYEEKKTEICRPSSAVKTEDKRPPRLVTDNSPPVQKSVFSPSFLFISPVQCLSEPLNSLKEINEQSNAAFNLGGAPVAERNETGIPDGMKKRFENLSGFSFDDVRVHYNSDKPAQLQALAYTQGNQVYVGPGQEKHLPHELGHVVQQMREDVCATTYQYGVPINDDPMLERGADRLEFSATSKRLGANFGGVVQRLEDDVDPFSSDNNRNEVQQFFSDLAIGEINKDLILYSYIQSDGLGDAGQLKLLYHKLLPYENLHHFKITVLCAFNLKAQIADKKIPKPIETSVSSEETRESYYTETEITEESAAWPLVMKELWDIRKNQIQSFFPENVATIFYVGTFGEVPVDASSKPWRAHIERRSNWEIEYPVPDPEYTTDHILKIKEMGQDLSLEILTGMKVYKAGDLYGGLGYGVPANPISIPSDHTESAERFFLSQLNSQNYLDYLNGAWIISAKQFEYSIEGGKPLTIEMQRRIIDNACLAGAKLIIFIGGVNSDSICIEGDTYILYYKSVKNETLRDLMSKVKNGVIVSGGEGMFAESLSNEDDETASVLAGRYIYQYNEIAHALLEREELAEWDGTKEAGKKYRFFYHSDKNDFFYYDDDEFKNLRFTGFGEQILTMTDEQIPKLLCSPSLSALYLPLSINGGDYKKPNITINVMKKTFADMKKQLQRGSWFGLIDEAMASSSSVSSSIPS